jgi:hypothetical protein
MCLWSVFFSIVLSVESGKLGWLEWRWLGVFIAPTTILVVGWLLCRWAHRTVRWSTGHSTINCPVCATSNDNWGLELLTVEVVYPFGAPVSPVAHRTVRCDLSSQIVFWLLTLQTVDQSTVVDQWAKMTVACGLTGQSGGTPDSLMIFSRGVLWFPEKGQFAECSSVTPGFGRQTECELCTCQDQNSRTQRLHKWTSSHNARIIT